MAVNPNPAPGVPTIVVIPARLAATRLPGKPLADLNGLPMIVHVWRRAIEAAVGPVVVACGDPEIRDALRPHGADAVLTDPALPSGTDRIQAALEARDPERRFRRIVNLQGDLPTLEPAAIRAVVRPLDRLGADIGTLAAPTDDPADKANPDIVKAVLSFPPGSADLARALYFTRACAPSGAGPVFHHIGIYAFSRAALERFARLPPSPLERRERLEQLRALEAGMTIGVAVVDAVPLGVDSPADLEAARALLRR
jgi:3-deoxy-manno-octulosonate cytidylyltransferase (CMP-KDO synthetase)